MPYAIPENLKGSTVYTAKGEFVLDDNLSQENRALLVKEFQYPLIFIKEVKDEPIAPKSTQTVQTAIKPKNESKGGQVIHQK